MWWLHSISAPSCTSVSISWEKHCLSHSKYCQAVKTTAMESTRMLTGEKRHPGTDYRIILPLALSSYIFRNDFVVNTLQGPRESTNPFNYFTCQWLQLQETFLDVLRMSVHKGHTRDRPRNICGFMFRRDTFHIIYCSLSHYYEYSVYVSMVG